MKTLYVFLSFLVSITLHANRLDSQWKLSIAGQAVQPSSNGTFRITNITTPDRFGTSGSGSAPDFISDDFVRLTGYKISSSGATRYVWSQPFQIRNRETFIIADSDLTFSDTPLIEPEFVRVTAPKVLLRTVDETTQLTTTAIFPDLTPDLADNPTEDITPRSKYTVYRSSNPSVLNIGIDGLVTARGNGKAIITAVNSMVSGSLEMEVDTTVFTTVEGIVRYSDQTPVVGATVTAKGRTTTTDPLGKFTLADVSSGLNGVIDVVVNGPPTVSRTVKTIPNGISDAGIILLGAISNQGNEFIVLFQRNHDGSPIQTLFATSSEAAFGTIEGPGFANSVSFQIPASGVATQVIPNTMQLLAFDGVENKGIRVVADRPFQLYGLSQKSATTDAYTAIPVEALGSRYRVLSYPALSSGPDTASQFAFVATQDNTSVTITPSVTVGSRTAGAPYTVALNRLQTYQLQTNVTGRDLTGTLIVADKPVAMFSGHSCGNVPSGTSACDHMIEQLPSTDTWGTSFVTVSLASRTGGDIIRVMADQDNTAIQVTGGTTISRTLNAGQFHEFLGPNINLIESDKPVLVAQYSRGQSADGRTGDPFMMLIPPAGQFLKSYIFTTPVGNAITNHFVNVVAKTDDVTAGAVLLDGVAVPSASFTAVPGTEFSAARLTITAGDHAISSPQPLGIYVYGFGSFDSYGYPGGLGLERLRP
ncbi:MAG: hypothetical protein IPK22_19055 [Verrucomicrobiaceae bacterium]|nr:hypothetical protein [Verrucomicrobiaceae bacterium]